ncbi:MAG: hypothetical protein LBQ60_19825 [Bacteroidales bacterium]|jgi:AraC-like DNA-binding protein|nr:hypothetical protein [Bacteroidales bacterium]
MEKEKLFLRFLTLAKLYFKEEQDTGFYAEQLGISPVELSDITMEHTGRSPSEWVKEMRKRA